MTNNSEEPTTAQDPNKFLQASAMYRSNSEGNLSGFEIVVELYKGMIRNIEQAKEAHQDGRLEDMTILNQKTNKILIALQSHLDFENGGEASVFLNQFYNGIFATLAQVLRKPDPAQEFDNVLNNIQPVYEIWCRHAAAQA